VTVKRLVLDIETMPNLAYTFSTRNAFLTPAHIQVPVSMASFAAKWIGKREVLYASTFHDGVGPMRDLAFELLDEADVVIHYNGKRFDIPHLNRELIVGGYSVPSPYKQVDLYQVASKRFKFATSNLEEVATELGVGHKVPHEGFALWLKCMAGDEAAWARFRRYNIGDVRLTEKVHDKLLPWIPSYPNPALYTDDATQLVCRCGSTKLHKRGRAYTPLGVFQQYRCVKCGTWKRGGKRLDGVDIRDVS
jgi:DNA polymerase elongation subunit (family B)